MASRGRLKASQPGGVSSSPARSRTSTKTALGLGLALAVVAGSGIARAHERWVPNKPRFPINHKYFQAMTGEVLFYSLLATAAVFGVVVLWYISAPGIVEALSPVTAAAREREARRNIVSRGLRLLVRLALDGIVEGRAMQAGLRVTAFVFAKIPAFVLALGAYEGWLIMPSFPVSGDVGDGLRIASVVLALWVIVGVLPKVLATVMFGLYVYLWVEYGIAAVDAIPVLASAVFYLFQDKRPGAPPVNARQLLGMRVCLGVGFFMLGLINKIFLAELFIGVADQHPQILIEPQAVFPGLTREAWSFTTALGEMVFGLLLLIGVFNRITTVMLALIFVNFIFVFGWDEIVHVYPVAGFALLFFRGRFGTSLDGIVFRANLQLWRGLSRLRYRLVYRLAVTFVAGIVAVLLMFTPLFVITEIAPAAAGIAVSADYKPPPPVPPAKDWDKIPAAPPRAAVPHGDHDPRFGGVVTMVGDHHVEVVVRQNGAVLLYPSDAVRRPIPALEAPGVLRIDRPSMHRELPLFPDGKGALYAAGPPATVATDYTYDLTIRGVKAALTLAVPPGGTDVLVRRGVPKPPAH